MKASEKKVLYSFFCKALDCIEGFASKDVEVEFVDDEDRPFIENPSSLVYSDASKDNFSKRHEEQYKNIEELKQDVLCCSGKE